MGVSCQRTIDEKTTNQEFLVPPPRQSMVPAVVIGPRIRRSHEPSFFVRYAPIDR